MKSESTENFDQRDDSDIEGKLASLAAHAGMLDLHKILYEAGRRSVRPVSARSNSWSNSIAVAVPTALLTSLLTFLVVSPRSDRPEKFEVSTNNKGGPLMRASPKLDELADDHRSNRVIVTPLVADGDSSPRTVAELLAFQDSELHTILKSSTDVKPNSYNGSKRP